MAAGWSREAWAQARRVPARVAAEAVLRWVVGVEAAAGSRHPTVVVVAVRRLLLRAAAADRRTSQVGAAAEV